MLKRWLLRRILPVLAVLLVVWLGWRIYGYFSCGMRWQSTGYESRYTMMAGCLIKQSNDKWLPEDKVRPE